MSKSQTQLHQPPPAPLNPFKGIRRAGTPIIAIETADPAATIVQCLKTLNGNADKLPVLRWDIIRGLTAENKPGSEYLEGIDQAAKLQFSNPSEALRYLGDNPPRIGNADEARGGIVFMCNAHLCCEQNKEPNLSVIQAIWNLRDNFKAIGASLVLLSPSMRIPAELSQDIVTVTEEAPSATDIETKVKSLCDDAGIDTKKIDMPKTVDALLGYLSLFAVEQSASIAITHTGKADVPDVSKLWDLKVQNLKQCAGLEVSLPTAGFEAMEGNDGVKAIIQRHLNGREKPRAILWLDEIEKMIAGGTSDLSGTTQAVLEQFLFWTQARKVKGFMLLGIPGAGKSLTCQTTAGEAKCPLLRASLSTVKGSLVGQSEQNMKAMLKSVDAVAQGRVLMLATCNSLDAVTPEVMARFNLGAFFYDYPSNTEAKSIWNFYMKKFQIEDQPTPDKFNWVGREIESCCERAYMWNIPLAEAAASVVPVCTANAEKMRQLRTAVSGRFLSAARPEIYRFDGTDINATANQKLT